METKDCTKRTLGGNFPWDWHKGINMKIWRYLPEGLENSQGHHQYQGHYSLSHKGWSISQMFPRQNYSWDGHLNNKNSNICKIITNNKLTNWTISKIILNSKKNTNSMSVFANATILPKFSIFPYSGHNYWIKLYC